MPKIFKIGILISCCGTWHIQAQSYYPMIIDSSRWFYRGEWVMHYYTFKGDTIIDEKKYKELNLCELYYDTGYNKEGCTPDFYPEMSMGLIREDTIEQRVYHINTYKPKLGEYILYDFSLNVEDSIQLIDASKDWYWYKVKEISYISTSKGDRKKIYLVRYNNNKSSGSKTWVEGIGGLYGFMYDIVMRYQEELVCYYQGDSLIYTGYYYTFFNTCVLESSGSVNSNSTSVVTIGPNPAYDQLQITLTQPSVKFIEIINMCGMVVFRDEICSISVTVDVSGFPTGIYFVRVYGQAGGQEGGWTGKVVIGE